MIAIWYILHYKNQNERKFLDIYNLKDAFVFTYDRMRRFQGEWHLERQLLFPAYVFLESNDIDAVLENLRWYEGTAGFTQKSKSVLPLNRYEQTFLMSLCGEEHHLGMSKGMIRDGVLMITEGPLRGMEERICRIDRHKRLARLDVPAKFTAGYIWAGLEVVEKK